MKRKVKNNRTGQPNMIKVDWVEPKILELVRIGENKDTLKMEVDFDTPKNSTIEIRRIEKDLFEYDDIGMMCKHWSLKKIMYEFEYPKWFRGELVKLPITNEIKTDEYTNDTRMKEVNSYSKFGEQLGNLDLNKDGDIHIDLGGGCSLSSMREGTDIESFVRDIQTFRSEIK